MNQKGYLLLENLDHLIYLNIHFELVFLECHLFQLIALLKPDSNCFNSCILFETDKVTK